MKRLMHLFFIVLILFPSVLAIAQDDEEEYIDCEDESLSDEDYEMYCTDEFEEEEYIDCYDESLSDEEYELYCADYYYEDYVDCEDESLSDEDYAYYCEFDYEDYEDEYGDFIEDEEFDDNFTDDSESRDEDVGGAFEVADGAVLGSDASDDAQALWNTFASIIPAEWVSRISSFEIVDDPETSGYVYVDENDPTKFVLGLNPVELNEPEELRHTVVHEFAHILTLNSGQFSASGTCSTLEVEEGCTNRNSYINRFYDQFWSNEAGSDASDFVSDYASSNVAEDIAESFAMFVLSDQPAGTSIADQKVNFFYNFPDLVQLRQQIRANLANFG